MGVGKWSRFLAVCDPSRLPFVPFPPLPFVPFRPLPWGAPNPLKKKKKKNPLVGWGAKGQCPTDRGILNRQSSMPPRQVKSRIDKLQCHKLRFAFLENGSQFAQGFRELARSQTKTNDVYQMNALETNTRQQSKDAPSPGEPEFAGALGKTMTPPAFSLAASPLSPPASGLSVAFGPVMAANTPFGMTDRIPPRVVTPVSVEVDGWSSEMGEIEITVENTGGPQGAALVNGKPNANLGGSGTLDILGTQQTAPGAGGKLYLVAKLNGVVVGMGKPFCVAAIPQNWSCNYAGPLTGAERGFWETTDVESDSGVKGDLSQVKVKEK
ncbi:MAG: hypothetical protein U0176_04145 [Bacteroidia bacterium]